MKNIISLVEEYGNARAKYMCVLREYGSSTDPAVIKVEQEAEALLQEISKSIAGKMTDRDAIVQISARLKNSAQKHVVYSGEDIDNDQWKKDGCPCLWRRVEESGEFVVFLDDGYGQLALFENGVLLEVGRKTIVTDNCVVMAPGSTGTKKFIWR